MRKIVEERAGGATRIIEAKSAEKGALKSFHEAGVGIFFAQPVQGGLEKLMEGAQIGVRLGDIFDDLSEVGGGEKTRVRLAKARMGLLEAGFFEMVE